MQAAALNRHPPYQKLHLMLHPNPHHLSPVSQAETERASSVPGCSSHILVLRKVIAEGAGLPELLLVLVELALPELLLAELVLPELVLPVLIELPRLHFRPINC